MRKPADPRPPLPFTPVDELGCYVDSAAEPNSIHLEVLLDGHLDAARLRAAVLATLTAHPLARVRRARWRGWHRRFNWEVVGSPDVAPVDHVRWRTEDELAGHRRSLLDAVPPLDLAPPLRIRHAVGTDRDVLILNVHHAAMDGLSCLRLLRSVARCYAGRPDPVGADPLAVRTSDAGTAGDAPRTRSPGTAARIAADSADPGPGCGFHLTSVPIATVRSGQGKPVATVNDILIAALVLAVGTWNENHGRDADTIRITMPINARATAGADEPLGNLSRLTVITSTPADRRSADGLLTDINRQTASAKTLGGPQLDPVSRLFATPWLPVAAKARLLTIARRLTALRIADTAMLSNLGLVGEPPDFGADAPVAGLWFSPPVRMPAGLSVGVVTANDRLGLCFRYRRELLDARAAARFAEAFHAALDSLGDPRLSVPR
ncbi:hypothetical protein [Actinophytocola sp.]|uniref:hypothetical protein n=1 Tax=Actinophytocola sp. TaxID=1872138 RepID=UPI002ED31632